MGFEEVVGPQGEIGQDKVRKEYEKLTRMLIVRKITIATMESCTGGFLASLLTDTEGSSEVFRGSYVTYSNEAKILNGVPKEIVERFGVYSVQTAASMAEACRRSLKTDIGVGITGSFGNADPANPDSVPGEVFFSIAGAGGTESFHCTVPHQSSRFAYKLYMADVVAARLFEIIGR